MKKIYIKTAMIVLISAIFILVDGNVNKKKVTKNVVVNSVLFNSDLSYNTYQEEEMEKKVYKDLTLKQLADKINSQFNSTLAGYGEIIASKSLEKGVDPVVAASIILLETGCKWECSYLVKHNHNIGGMRGNGGYLSYPTLDEGIDAFINNLAYNYYQKGLNTPELMNRKYAANPEWYKKVRNYMNLIETN